MQAQAYTFKVTYQGCENKIWRTIDIPSDNTIARLGYSILATFDTLAYHLFEMTYKDIIYINTEEDAEYLEDGENYAILRDTPLNGLGITVGEHILMRYDFDCNQLFDIELIAVRNMKSGNEITYPIVIDGDGFGIIDDMPSDELLKLIHKIDAEGKSGFVYEEQGYEQEWDYRNYDINKDYEFFQETEAKIELTFELFD